MRAILVPLALGFATQPLQAHPLELSGRAGYLSEWQIRASVADADAGGAEALSGPVTLKHTGLCTVSGPVEKAGRMDVKVSGWGPFATVEVNMRFPTASCVYRGRFSRRMTGAMDCSDAKDIPVELSVD